MASQKHWGRIVRAVKNSRYEQPLDTRDQPAQCLLTKSVRFVEWYFGVRDVCEQAMFVLLFLGFVAKCFLFQLHARCLKLKAMFALIIQLCGITIPETVLVVNFGMVGAVEMIIVLRRKLNAATLASNHLALVCALTILYILHVAIVN